MIKSKVVEEWKEEGRTEGRIEGRAEGEAIGQIRLLQSLLNEPVQDQAAFRDLSIEQLQRLAEELRHRFAVRTNGNAAH